MLGARRLLILWELLLVAASLSSDHLAQFPPWLGHCQCCCSIRPFWDLIPFPVSFDPSMMVVTSRLDLGVMLKSFLIIFWMWFVYPCIIFFSHCRSRHIIKQFKEGLLWFTVWRGKESILGLPFMVSPFYPVSRMVLLYLEGVFPPWVNFFGNDLTNISRGFSPR